MSRRHWTYTPPSGAQKTTHFEEDAANVILCMSVWLMAFTSGLRNLFLIGLQTLSELKTTCMRIQATHCDNHPRSPLSQASSISRRNGRKWLLDQARTAVLSYAMVFLLCCGIDVLFHGWVASQNYDHSQYAAAKNTGLTLGEKHPHIFQSLIQILIAPVLPFIQVEYMLVLSEQLHVGYSQKYVLMPCLLVHLVLYNSPALLSSAVIVTSPGVCIQLTKQFCCSGMDRALGHAIILNQ